MLFLSLIFSEERDRSETTVCEMTGHKDEKFNH